jgi:hypothetical protein
MSLRHGIMDTKAIQHCRTRCSRANRSHFAVTEYLWIVKRRTSPLTTETCNHDLEYLGQVKNELYCLMTNQSHIDRCSTSTSVLTPRLEPAISDTKRSSHGLVPIYTLTRDCLHTPYANISRKSTRHIYIVYSN